MTKVTGALALGLIGLFASPAAASPRAAFHQIDGVWQRTPDGCGTPQRAARVPADADPFAFAPVPAIGLRTVYLNRRGGTYTVGSSTDAATNRVSNEIIDMVPFGSTFTIPALDTTRYNWTTISSCVRTHFRRFNINVVETEPAAGTPYIEAVVGGNGQEIGFGANELFGIASADNFCNVTEKGIAFNFSETHNNVPRRDDELCATIAHEVGHLIALEHEQLSTDVMSYVLINDSSTKAFVDQASGCGTSPQSPQSCYCTSGSTNSYARLKSFIGLRDVEMVPPVVSVAALGEVVPPTFDVVVTATDNAMMSEVFVQVDNVEAGSDATAENNVYTITVRNLREGSHQLAVIAYDAAGNVTRKEVPIVVQKLATGETCLGNEVCAGGICAQSPEGNFCTQACDPAASSCPAGFECAAAGGSTVCIPAEETGCGCASSRSPGPVLLLAFGLGAVLLRRRRR